MKSKSTKTLMILMVLIIFILIIAGFVFSKPSEKRAYDKYLKKNTNTTINFDDYTKVKLKRFEHKTYIDLNEDGTKELILTFAGEGQSADDFIVENGFIGEENPAIVLTYHNKEVKILGKYVPYGGGCLKYVEDEHCFTVFDRLAGEGHIKVYQISNGEFKEKLSMDHYQPYHYDLDSEKEFYFMNGKEINKSDFYKNWNHYYKDARLIKMD